MCLDNQSESDPSLHVITPTSTTNHDYVNIPRHASVAHSQLSGHNNYHDTSYINCSYQTSISISSRASHACHTIDTRALPPRTHQAEVVVKCTTCTHMDGPCKINVSLKKADMLTLFQVNLQYHKQQQIYLQLLHTQDIQLRSILRSRIMLMSLNSLQYYCHYLSQISLQ